MTHLVPMLVKTAPLVHRVSTLGGVLKRAKFVLRGLVFAPRTKEWFEFLRRPELAKIVRRHPCLYHKLQRPYLSCALNTSQRLDALENHYRFVTDHFSPRAVETVYEPAGFCLAGFDVRDVGSCELRLCCSRREKEGDLSICLVKKDEAAELFTLSFSIWKYDGARRELFIGGLQGHRLATKEWVVSITRNLHGLRPKALLVIALQQLAACWHIPALRAVSDGRHIYRHFQKRKVLSAQYDEFWIDCGGELSPDGIFTLPAAFVPRDLSTIKVNKRQMYRRRYAMLADILGQIRNSASELGSPLPSSGRREPAPSCSCSQS